MSLDGLRGVAAFEVLIYHRRGAVSPTIAFHGYLGVDFFFMLSGFVIAHAYWQRLARGDLTFSDFLRLRAERLGPLIVLGVTLGSLVLLAKAVASGDPHNAIAVVLGWVPSMLLLPNPLLEKPFLADGPTWSLMFEVIGNIGFALGALWLLRRWNLGTAIVCSLAALLAVAIFQGTIAVGNEWSTLAYGLPRMAASFLIGIGLYRWWAAGRAPRIGLPFGVLCAILTVFLMTPPEVHRLPVPVYEMGCVLLAFPAIVLAGAQREPGARSAPVARLSAELSYPLYILHMPCIYALDALSRMPADHPRRALAVLLLVAVPLSFAASRWFDLPVRRWLAQRRLVGVGPGTAA